MHQAVLPCAHCCVILWYLVVQNVLWIKMIGYVWDTYGNMFMLFITCKNTFNVDSVR
jgi:hypothetical protein